MFTKRYAIHIRWIENGNVTEPKHFYDARTFRTFKAAHNAWWDLTQREWDFTNDLPLFSIYDRKTGRYVG